MRSVDVLWTTMTQVVHSVDKVSSILKEWSKKSGDAVTLWKSVLPIADRPELCDPGRLNLLMEKYKVERAECWLEGTALRRLLSQRRSLQRTPEWDEPVKQTKKKQKKDDLAITKPLSELYFDLELRTERTVDHGPRPAKPPVAKRKTKGVPGPFAPAAPTSPDNDEPHSRLVFQLDVRAHRVFRTLFYTPSLNATPGEVPWTDFLHAMVSTGFAPEKLYGSVWQFKPTKLDAERSIQFHEPHPSGKLPYKTARRFGRRLNRAYGWEGGMFVLK